MSTTSSPSDSTVGSALDGAAVEREPAAPALRFRFIGSWFPIIWNRFDSPELIDRFVDDTFGRRDDLATIRAKARRDLRAAVEVARRGDAQAMFLATEIQPGLPMPITLTVFAPSALRMSPTIGVDPDAVMATFRKGLTLRDTPELPTAAALEIAGARVLRLHRVLVQPLADAPGFE
ncbi:MAG TPA: hypothetical protein VFY91_12150, partial [Microbacterium sp.]|nr:hypothetical protein [Microbacterium sp.]